MQEKYLWEIPNQLKEKKLDKDIETDILIVGGGITGMSIAFELRNSNYKITVVDQNKCGNGVTMRTTGKLTYLQENIYSKLEKTHGPNIAKLYLKSQQDAIKIVKNHIQKYKIDCNFQEVASYTFIINDKNKQKLANEFQTLSKWQKIEKEEKLPNSFPIIESIKAPKTAVFHPLKYLLTLKKICKDNGVLFYEDTMVTNVSPNNNDYIISTDKFHIKAKIVVVSCHYPFFLFPFMFPMKTYLEKSYIGAFPVEKAKNFSAINLDNDTYSFRYYQDKKQNYFLCLSETHKLSNSVNYSQDFWNLKDKFSKIFKQKDIPYIWSNYDIMTDDYLPLVGRINNNEKNLYLATGFNTWGMTNGILSGKIISDLILEKENPYIALFNPLRSFSTTKLINDLINNFIIAKIFIKTKIKKNYNFYPANVRVETRDGKKCGIYIDSNGVEHIVSNLCPHMKCSLIFNIITATWDCPCHGSKFDIDGNILKGPSVYNIKIK